MKSIIKGVIFAIALVAVANICGAGEQVPLLSGVLIFFVTAYVFLVEESIAKLLICGFFGAGGMFVLQIFLLFALDDMISPNQFENMLLAYVGGFFGSMAALVFAIVETLRRERNVKIMNEIQKKDIGKLLLYTLLTAVSFAMFVMPRNSGIGLIIFVLIQALCFNFFVKVRKKLVFFIPMLITAVNGFVSANTAWRIPNFIVGVVMYGCIFSSFDIKDDSFSWISALMKRMVLPVNNLSEPFYMAMELGNNKSRVIKRVITALAISVPLAFVLIAVLANADMVFLLRTGQLIEAVLDVVSLRSMYVIVCSILAALYLFGVVRNGDKEIEVKKTADKKGDLIIINIIMAVVILIYAMFAVIQFKYLFATTQLPEGLSYTVYARKGFFELLALSGVNIAGILAAVKCTRSQSGAGSVITKVFCHCLCAMTVILLVSSFYRMCLYTNDGGLTRMRLYVLGFLIFEAIGLIASFVYIQKPKFNIVLIYSIIALSYYLLLNIVPTDSVIAYDQVHRFLDGRSNDISYAATLSADAVPAMEYLIENTRDEYAKNIASDFIKYKNRDELPKRWQRFNISRQRAEKIKDKLITK